MSLKWNSNGNPTPSLVEPKKASISDRFWKPLVLQGAMMNTPKCPDKDSFIHISAYFIDVMLYLQICADILFVRCIFKYLVASNRSSSDETVLWLKLNAVKKGLIFMFRGTTCPHLDTSECVF